MTAPQRFTVHVPDHELDDLRDRLRRTRWPTPWPAPSTGGTGGTGWETGTEVGELRRLVEHWAGDYDWRRHEAEINALPSYVVDVAGTPVHHLRFDGEHPDALPIVLTHGWPSTFLELVELARRLSAPSQHGGRAEDSFTVVVPSLPGYAFSPQRPGLQPDEVPTHELWHRLMHDELGFERYGAHGGDLGAGITSDLGQAHPEAVVGIHLLAVRRPADLDPATITEEEQAFLDSGEAWTRAEGGYQHEQSTRPMTLAYGLADSPAGLLAWIVEKYRAWSDSGGDLSSRFSDDLVLTQASLYWFTASISTSFRPYFEHAHRTHVPGRVEVPTGVAVFPRDLVQPPRSWVERSYRVTSYTTMPRGGHFAAHEEPGLLAEDLTQFFRPLR